ncbi:MAG: hypothetical protein R3C20_21805 [Planctomycetaceae bacterium]
MSDRTVDDKLPKAALSSHEVATWCRHGRDLSASGLCSRRLENRWLTPPAGILSGSALSLSGSGWQALPLD